MYFLYLALDFLVSFIPCFLILMKTLKQRCCVEIQTRKNMPLNTFMLNLSRIRNFIH
jgi:hypothetical protein